MARFVKESNSFTCHFEIRAFSYEWNEAHMSLLSQTQLVGLLIYLLRMDGRLSWPRRHSGK